MELYQAIVLGIIQGLTEFLPVSSSGHLVLGQNVFGLREPELLFDVSVHIGTLAAVVIVFGREICSILASLGRFAAAVAAKQNLRVLFADDADLKMALLIVIGSIPTALIGLMLNQVTDRLFSSILIVGMMLLITGTVLWGTRWIKNEKASASAFSVKSAVLIGLVQGFAVMPGISRSGSTIAAGLFWGLKRETAARYSFLLSIPAIVGAEILTFKDAFGQGGASIGLPLLMGTAASFVVGYLALILLLRVVRKGQLHLFAPYCWLLGIGAVVAGW